MNNKNILYLIGHASAFSYLTVILATWILTHVQGYTYFSAGEPEWYILYPEWILGIVSITVIGMDMVTYLRDSIHDK